MMKYNELTKKQKRILSDTRVIILVVNSIEFMTTMCYLKPCNSFYHVVKIECRVEVSQQMFCGLVILELKVSCGCNSS